jgi:multiple sugar transport system substrate-binding protein
MTRRISGPSMLSGRTNRRRFVGTSAIAAASASMLRMPGAYAQDAEEVTWSSWGNTGEVANLQEFTDSYNASQSEVAARYIPVPTDGYADRLLTQLNGGTAPDLFYVGDGQIAILVQNEVVADLTERLTSEASRSRPEDFAGDLWGPSQTDDGRFFGVPVDCNPLVIWYNAALLRDAGFTDMPADLYEEGGWTWDTFQSMLDGVQESGRRGFVVSDWWAHRSSWITNNGGSIYEDGRFVANEDPASVEAIQWLADNIASETILFSGSLPEGQGDDAMFMSGQLAFVSVGRWGLPLFRQNENIEFDVVPYPTNTGNQIEPSAVAVAYWCMNANPSADPDTAFEFYTHFVSPEGQQERLNEGGNAVPSIEGAEDVVLDDSLPEHKQYFLDARDVGYGPMREEAGTPGLSTELNEIFSELWLNPTNDVQATLDEAAAAANAMIEEHAG